MFTRDCGEAVNGQVAGVGRKWLSALIIGWFESGR